jgi:nicotinamide-nucleotide amidase
MKTEMPMGEDLPDNAHQLAERAATMLQRAKDAELSLSTAESCTGGLLASLLTDIEGLSGSFERGFVTYSNEAKCEQLGIELALIEAHGAVSAEVAEAMVRGALDHSRADLACAITGFAGQGQDKSDEAGNVFVAVQRRRHDPLAREFHFGDMGREAVRHHTVAAALEMLEEAATAKTRPLAHPAPPR